MTTACHAAAGALVGSLVGHPAAGFAAGVASHAVLDVVPHYDLADYRIDVALTIAIGVSLLVVGGGEAGLVWGLVGGALPDLENLFYKLGWIRDGQRIFPTHGGPLPHGRALGPAHALWQVAIVAFAYARAAA